MLLLSFSSYYDVQQCKVEDDDLFYLAYRKERYCPTMRRKKKTHFFLCPQSIERASMNMYLIAILSSRSLSRARLFILINLLSIIPFL